MSNRTPLTNDQLQDINIWQPIETAPKDGTKILGYDPDIGVSTMSYFDDGSLVFYSKSWIIALFDVCDECYPKPIGINPTHWMPLPPPPQQEGE